MGLRKFLTSVHRLRAQRAAETRRALAPCAQVESRSRIRGLSSSWLDIADIRTTKLSGLDLLSASLPAPVARRPLQLLSQNLQPISLPNMAPQDLRSAVRLLPPPAPPTREIPPVPSLPSQRGTSRPRRRNNAGPEITVLPSATDDDDDEEQRGLYVPHSPSGRPLLSQVSQARLRPRSRRGTITNERPVASPGLMDDMPPLRRMNGRSINERTRTPSPQLVSGAPQRRRREERHYFSESDNESANGDAHDRSLSPDANQWETLLTTITPDPSLPVSAETSFNSAATSFPAPPPRWAPSDARPRVNPWLVRSPRLRPTETPLSPLSRPAPFEDPIDVVDDQSPPTPPSAHESLRDNLSFEPVPARDPTTLQSPISSSNLDSPSQNPDIHALYSAISTLRDRTDRLVSSFCSLAESFQSSSPVDLGATHAGTSDEEEGSGNHNEIRALVEDVNALHDSLERTVRARAEARAHRVSHGADPLLHLREPSYRSRGRQERARRVEAGMRSLRDAQRRIREQESTIATLDVNDLDEGIVGQHRTGRDNSHGDGLSLADVLQDTDGILTRLRSRDETVRQAALSSLPADTRRTVLSALERSRESIHAAPRRARRSRPSFSSHRSHHQSNHQPAQERSEAERLASARESLRGMESAIGEMETMAQEPGATDRQMRELRDARDRLERMRSLLGAVERGEGIH
ncbi:MAG: hypothetical protein Q9162_005641 [Coniocarpon cinnabarinum]